MNTEQIKELTEKLKQCGYEDADVIANRVFNLGYRKQSDTIKEFAEKLQQVIDKAELVVQEMHSKYHLTFGAEQKAYSNAYNATVAIRECIEKLKKEYGVE